MINAIISTGYNAYCVKRIAFLSQNLIGIIHTDKNNFKVSFFVKYQDSFEEDFLFTEPTAFPNIRN